jgi:hypothetical protein
MASERFIDVQLIKPLSKGSSNKGKISLTNLLKEYFDKLNVGYLDPCCPVGSPGAFGCPAISSAVGNSITCNQDGLYVTAGATLAAINGLSISSGKVVLGQDLAQVGNPAAITTNRQIPTGGFNIFYTGAGRQSVGYPDTTISPFTTIDVNGTFGVSVGTAGYPTTGMNSGVGATLHLSHQGATWGLGITKSGAGSANFGALLTFYRTSGTNASTKASVAAGQPIGSITYQAVAADNTSVATAAAIHCKIASTTGSVVRGYLTFNTAENTGFIANEKMVLSPDGNLTIGTNISTLGESDFSQLRVHQSLSGATAYNGIHLTTIWGTSGVPTAFKVDVTDNASDATSLLMDLQVGASSKFKVAKTGVVTTSAGTVFAGNSGAAAPSTTAGGTITNRYGGNTNFLGDPNSWTSVVIGGVTYKIPLYT